ncbi:hypothetical protein NKJ22_34505, partial [Mesorhizobium sp. M0220]
CALTEYKVDWVRSRTASRKRTHRMDLRIAAEVHDNVDVMPFVVDHPHIRVSELDCFEGIEALIDAASADAVDKARVSLDQFKGRSEAID